MLVALFLVAPFAGLAPTAEAASTETVGKMPLKIVGASAVAVGSVTYIFGGRNVEGDYSNAILKFDHTTGSVTQVATFPGIPGSSNGGRQSGSAVLVGSVIYYFGGAAIVEADLDGDGKKEAVPRAIRDIVEFDPATNNARKILEELPAGAWGVVGVANGGKAYVFGGFSFDVTNPGEIQRRDWVLRFDTGKTVGTRLTQLSARLPYAVQDAAGAMVGNRIYILGGLSDNHATYNPCPVTRQYNSTSSQYEERPQSTCTTDRIISFDPAIEAVRDYAVTLPNRMQFVSAVSAGGKAYLAGGRLADGSASAEVVVFSPGGTPPMRTLTPRLPSGIFGAPLSVDPRGTVFTFGGRGGGLSDLTDAIYRIDPAATIPYPPRNLTTGSIPGGVKLSWEPPAYDGDAPVSSYRLYRTAPGTEEARIAEVSVLSYEDTTARPGLEYAYRVTAVNLAGESATGARATRATDATPPGVPQNVRAFSGNTQVVLRWELPLDNGGSNITGYRVHRDGSLLKTVPALPREMVDTGLQNGKSYTYSVIAYNVKGNGQASSSIVATPAPVPEAPQGVTADVSESGVLLNWFPTQSPSDRYVILRGTTPGELTSVGESAKPGYTDATATRGRTYYYAIAAANTVGQGPPSSTISASLVSKPGAPRNVFVAPLEGAVRITWMAPEDTGEAPGENLRYYLSRQDPGTERFRVLDTGGDLLGTSYTDARVVPGQTYTYTVTTTNPIASDPSAPATGAPKAITNRIPLAFIEGPANATAGAEVTFNGGKSTDSDGKIVTYRFDFGDGEDPVESTEPVVTRTFARDAFYTVRLTVVDDRGDSSDPVSHTLKVGEPKDKQDDTPGYNTVTRTTPGGAEPGSSTPRIPAPGLFAVMAALAAVALVLRRR